MSWKERGNNSDERNSEGEFREEGREKELWEGEEQKSHVICAIMNWMCFSDYWANHCVDCRPLCEWSAISDSFTF